MLTIICLLWAKRGRKLTDTFYSRGSEKQDQDNNRKLSLSQNKYGSITDSQVYSSVTKAGLLVISCIKLSSVQANVLFWCGTS